MQSWDLPHTLGALRHSRFSEEAIAARTVKDELRENLIAKMGQGEPLFPGVVGFEETVIPQIVNAVLSRHNFILLGLRGQAKTRLIRLLTTLLDPFLPVIAGSEIHDNPYRPLSKYARQLIEEMGEETPVHWLTPEQRYVEKLATPDVTIADMIGDIDPIKAARRGVNISDELTVHYGLLPRANRGIFAVNELPDLAGKIQVGLFNILQEGDVQIKGYPVRLPLDLMMVFTANPEDYTARGKIITPLKDRIGSEIRTHYPLTVDHGLSITRQEAWTARPSAVDIEVPGWIRETVEQIAFVAREDKRVDKRSGVSQRLPISVLENVISNAERRALLAQEEVAVPRVLDIYAALPSITGKIELEYEGELKGGDTVAREVIRTAIARVYSNHLGQLNTREIQEYFNQGGTLKLDEIAPSSQLIAALSGIDGLLAKTGALGLGANEPDAKRVAAAEFILEGLHALRRIGRSEELGFTGEERRKEPHEEDPFNRRRPDKRRTYN
ncbi:MAG: magnesium chelatase [Bryobacterales bacterium]|nr:magnesium chelatase [Bryobacterales bacterium]